MRRRFPLIELRELDQAGERGRHPKDHLEAQDPRGHDDSEGENDDHELKDEAAHQESSSDVDDITSGRLSCMESIGSTGE